MKSPQPHWPSVFGVRCFCFCGVTLSLSFSCRLKQPMCCSINAEMGTLPLNLNLQPRWEEPLKQQMTTWIQTEQPSARRHTRVHMANRDTWTHTQSFFSDSGLHRLNIIKTPSPYFIWVLSHLLSTRATTLSEEWPERLPAASGLLNSQISLVLPELWGT